MSQSAPRLVHTYSILARDAETGDLGVAVQSHWPGVGAQVAWARAGVGVVATQAAIRTCYGFDGLDRLEKGATAFEAFRELAAEDPEPEARQVALLGTSGSPFVHTGSGCIPEAGHLDDETFSVQGNFLASPRVLPAMADRFRAASGHLGDRMLAALEAAEAEGGDQRGRQAAAIQVVSGRGPASVAPVLDLRVDDHPSPLKELRRLHRIRRGYDAAEEATELVRARDLEGAKRCFADARLWAPEARELRFWFGVALLAEGYEVEAGRWLLEVCAEEARWIECLRRLPGTSAMPDAVTAQRQVAQLLSRD